MTIFIINYCYIGNNKTENIGNDNITWHMQRHSTRHAVRHRNSRKRAEYTDGIAALNGDGDALEQDL